MATEVDFAEASAEPRVESVPYAHLSLELGHLYMEDLRRGEQHLRDHFRRVAPWAEAATRACADAVGRAPRISTCFLVDDYFTSLAAPDVVVPQLVAAAADAGLRVDYLARESGCAEADGVPLAELVAGRLVAEPPPGTTGSRPPPAETGWLANGERSAPDAPVEAMGTAPSWSPPRETAANRHSIFADVQLWDDDNGRRTWSCPFLAAVWQLLRLGLLRHKGRMPVVPRPWDDAWPRQWSALPAVVRLSPDAAPFCGYRTVSVLAGRFLPVEHAVRVILGQVLVDPRADEQARTRGRSEGIELPAETVDRVDYVLTGGSAAWR
ncbi:MAG TPA: SCO2522 family protein [Pseudonocardiaceae bacterium]